MISENRVVQIVANSANENEICSIFFNFLIVIVPFENPSNYLCSSNLVNFALALVT
jgi:hypothetical protein